MTLPTVAIFPVRVPQHFVTPTDREGDGIDMSWEGKPCPCQVAPFKPAWGGGFDAGRVREGKSLAHRAIDIMGAQGLEIRSIGPGRVAKTWVPGAGRVEPGAGTSPKGGNFVVIDETQPDGSIWRWYYAHLEDKPLVSPGEPILTGQLLGFLGRTGNAVKVCKDGTRYGCPHLHLALTGMNAKALKAATARGLKVQGGKVDSVPLLKPLFEAGGWGPVHAS
jgi:murein DD-endopeptidase MepM/ murein hydrolase activator NlpD